MFDIGFQEIMVIMAIALVFIGPKNLPEVARTMGKWFGEFRRTLDDAKQDYYDSVRLEDAKEELLRQRPDLAGTPGAAAGEDGLPGGETPPAEIAEQDLQPSAASHGGSPSAEAGDAPPEPALPADITTADIPPAYKPEEMES